MKKVTNITLGDTVFVIEEDAYEALQNYLKAVEKAMTTNTDTVEIMLDIEHAIAEKCIGFGKDEKHAITGSDVNAIIVAMGKAEDIASEETTTLAETKDEDTEQGLHAKQLYRDTDDVIVAGVASGLARYFSIDPVIIRLLFLIFMFINGVGLVAYIIFWLIVPKAETTAQKYAMRGERMTLHEIVEHVKKKVSEIDTCPSENTKGFWKNTHSFLHEVFILLGSAFTFFLHFFRYIVSFFLILFGALSIAGVIAVLSVLFVGEVAWLPFEFEKIVQQLLSDTSGYYLLGALSATLFIPFLVILLIGGSLFAGKNLFSFMKVVTLGIVWITALTVFVSFTLISKPVFENSIEKYNIQMENIPTRGLMQ